MIDIIDHLPEAHIPEAARLYYTGLEAKLAPVFGPTATAMAVLPPSLHSDRCMAAIFRGRPVGILGIQDARGSFLSPAFSTMVKHYGIFSAIYRTFLLMVLNTKVAPGDLYLDGIVVAASHQGLGIGTALIRAFERRARDNGFDTVSLEVIDTNPRAHALYTRLGYLPTATHSMGPFSRLFDFRTSFRMVKKIKNIQQLQ